MDSVNVVNNRAKGDVGLQNVPSQNIFSRVVKGVLLTTLAVPVASVAYGLYTAGRVIPCGIAKACGYDWHIISPRTKRLIGDIAENYKFLIHGYKASDILKTESEGDAHKTVILEQRHKVILDSGEEEVVEESIRYSPENSSKSDSKEIYSPTWVSCNYTRDLLTEKSTDEFFEELKPIIPNLAVRSVKVGEESREIEESARGDETAQLVGAEATTDLSFTMCQCGAITDARYGNVSLPDLEKIENELITSKRTSLRVSSQSEDIKPEEGDETFLEGLKSQLTKEADKAEGKAKEYAQKSLNQLEGIETLESAQNIKKERVEWLGKQFCQLLSLQLENMDDSGLETKSDTKPHDELSMVGVGLLHDKAKTEKAGLIHNERVMKEDTDAIYKKFNGATVEFITQGDPRIAFKDDGSVEKVFLYKPENCKITSKEITIKASYMNISIDKDTENTEEQKAINRAALENLGLENDKDFAFLLNNTYLTEDDALKLANLLAEKRPNVRLTISCYSGKDRTGQLGAKLAKSQTEKQLKCRAPTMGSLGPDSLVVKAIEHNTGRAEVKLGIWHRGWSDTVDIIDGYVSALLSGKSGAES